MRLLRTLQPSPNPWMAAVHIAKLRTEIRGFELAAGGPTALRHRPLKPSARDAKPALTAKAQHHP